MMISADCAVHEQKIIHAIESNFSRYLFVHAFEYDSELHYIHFYKKKYLNMLLNICVLLGESMN